MTLDIRATGNPDRFDLFDSDDRIGEIRPDELADWEIAEGTTPLWQVTIWSAMGTGREWHESGDTLEEAKGHAPDLYEEFLAERRELSKGSSNGRTTSVAMGGQRGWRRR